MFWLVESNVDFWLAKKWALVIKVKFNILETFYYIHFRFKFYFRFNSMLEKVFPVLYTSSWYSTNHKPRFQINLQFQNNQKVILLKCFPVKMTFTGYRGDTHDQTWIFQLVTCLGNFMKIHKNSSTDETVWIGLS